MYYTVANTTDSYQIKVNSGYDVTLYDATYAAVSNTTYTYIAEITMTAEQVAQAQAKQRQHRPASDHQYRQGKRGDAHRRHVEAIRR